MPRAFSHPRLMAEAHAFPYASLSSYTHRLTTFDRPASGVLTSGPTTALAADLEDHLRLRANGATLEVLRQLRDAAWFSSASASPDPIPRLTVPLADHLRALAARFLLHAGRRVSLRPDGDPASRAAAWRWLSLFLPADLLVSALSSTTTMEPPDDGVLLVTPRLAETLRKPCAETHLHVGAGIPFGLLWAALSRDLAAGPTLKIKPTSGKPPFGGSKQFTSRLLAAFTLRLFLAAFLRAREQTGTTATFEPFLEAHRRALADAVPWGLGAHEALRALTDAYRHAIAARGAPDPPLERARRLYQALIGRTASTRKPDTTAEIVSRDPLASWLPWREGLALPESRFACRALSYLANPGPGRADGAFALAFWQYQRIRCITHSFLVEEPGTAGLDWFTRHYERISPLRGTLETLTYASALQLQSRDLSLGALEARTSPSARWSEVRDEVRALARAARRFDPLPGRDRPEVGLVLHFIKVWNGPGGKRLQADPRHRAFGCRFGPWYHDQLQRAQAMETALRHHPELLLVLRGMDVANVELAVPTWTVAPLFHRLRAASRRAAARLGRFKPRWEAAPLRATVHVGEDFRRLVEGLRRIHETLEFGMLEVGDRIGHGVALGEDPAKWVKASQVLTQPAEDRLDDLLWEIDRYRRRDLPGDAGRMESVRAEATELGRAIYDGPQRLDLDDLLEARRLRHDPRVLDHLGYPFFRERHFGRTPGELCRRYLSDPEVFERGQRPVEVEADDGEARMLASAQRWLRGELGKREITVESNPSSNLLIADYLGLDEHPAFRLSPLAGMEDTGPEVMVSVNTDNPVTFASTLADEFAHVHFALLGRDVPADAALGWLDRARENGFLSRFTLRASAKPKALLAVAPARRRVGARG